MSKPMGEIEWFTSDGGCGVLYSDHRTERRYDYECVPADVIERCAVLFKGNNYKQAFTELKPYTVKGEK